MKFACFSDLHFSSSGGVESVFQVSTTGDLLAVVELERDLEGDSPEAQVMMGSVSTAKLELRMEDGNEVSVQPPACISKHLCVCLSSTLPHSLGL